MLPLETIDRIEIIPDGASAVYGSDAVAGVINVILKDEYEGFRMKARYGSRGRDDGEETGISLLTGASTERGSFVAGFEHDSRDPIFDADRKFTAASKNDKNGDGVIQGYQETVGISIYGYTLLNPNYNWRLTILMITTLGGSIPAPIAPRAMAFRANGIFRIRSSIAATHTLWYPLTEQV